MSISTIAVFFKEMANNEPTLAFAQPHAHTRTHIHTKITYTPTHLLRVWGEKATLDICTVEILKNDEYTPAFAQPHTHTHTHMHKYIHIHTPVQGAWEVRHTQNICTLEILRNDERALALPKKHTNTHKCIQIFVYVYTRTHLFRVSEG